MASKYKIVREMYDQTLHDLNNPQAWTAFLRCACRNYKLRFDQQALIYAQRPQATAVLDIHSWNRYFHRRVKRGHSGIPVFEDINSIQQRLVYYFDLADTYPTQFSTDVPIWTVTEQMHTACINTLERECGELELRDTLAHAAFYAAENITGDHLSDYVPEIERLAKQQAAHVGKEALSYLYSDYFSLVENSAAYMILHRCGLDADETLSLDDFSAIAQLTPAEITLLGSITNGVSKSILSEIAKTVKPLQKDINCTFDQEEKAAYTQTTTQIEREAEHDNRGEQRDFAQRSVAGRPRPDVSGGAGAVAADENSTAGAFGRDGTDIQAVRGILSTRADTPAAGGYSPDALGTRANGLLEKPQEGTLHRPADQLSIAAPLQGNRGSGQRDAGPAHPRDGEGRGSGRGTEIQRPDAMGGTDEQHPQPRGGNDSARTDLRIEKAADEMSAVFSSPARLAQFQPLYPEITQRNQYKITDLHLGDGTPMQRLERNLTAIDTLKQIETEQRLATPQEQEILSNYVGWGGLSACFDQRNSNYPQLKKALTEDEFAAARESTLTAFYTPPVVVQSMYKALQSMNFTQGNILEPSCGTGNFIGMLPPQLSESRVYGVELDSISGRIAQQLYQNSSIAISGFERTAAPDNFFDVAVGNVPFGDFKVLDRRYDKYNWRIHDYFFGAALDKVRPGGVVAFITSKGTMDKQNSKVRKYLSQRADLIGAIRLPDNTFSRNAGTQVTSDIIFLQKREQLTDEESAWLHVDADENGVQINRYFIENPHMILGEMVMESGPYGSRSACKAREGRSLEELLNAAIGHLHADISDNYVEEEREAQIGSSVTLAADPNVRNYSYAIKDDVIYFRQDSRMTAVSTSKTAENRIRGLVALRDCMRTLMDYQLEAAPDELVQRQQAQLNQIYDTFIKEYGNINRRGNELAFREDSSYYLLCSLEEFDQEGNYIGKADMFTKRTIRAQKTITKVDTASEALAVSLSEKGHIDMAYMSKLTGLSEGQIVSDLQGVIYNNAGITHTQETEYVIAGEYLSGNVREKLALVRAAAQAVGDGSLDGNVKALEKAQPQELTAAEISVRIGATWVAPEIYRQFLLELLQPNTLMRQQMKVTYSKYTGEWNVSNKSYDTGNVLAQQTYGTSRVNAYHIFEQSLNLKDVKVYDTVIDHDGKEKRVFNKKETDIAQSKQQAIKTKFQQWIWQDIDRREGLCEKYNRLFNSVRPREYDGAHLSFPGMNPEITLKPHQINAIAHILYGGNTLLAHQVGAGKTFEMAAAAMEKKRLGLCNKSLVVVPNHIIGQFAAEWLQLYPSANLLVATKRDFETKNRKKFCARIATGDYDAIIIGHSQFEKIPMSRERQTLLFERQIEQAMQGIYEAKHAKADQFSIKQMERTKKQLEQRLAKLNDQSRKDDVIVFEDLGCDSLFVDESHGYKNLFLMTKMRNVGGIAQTDAQKSSDLFMKCQYLDELTNARGTVFATGTPISNSMVELYTIQRYLQYHRLQEMNLQHFDEWACTFGETVTEAELAPEGTGYREKTRFSKFYNLPELMSTFKEVADIQTADMLQLPVPKANFYVEVLPSSPLQQEVLAQLADRAEQVRSGTVDPSVDNMLRITNDGRKLALDERLIDPLAPENPNSKALSCAKNVHRIWQETEKDRAAQLIFCDLSTPKSDGTFNVYEQLRTHLIEMGIPENEIAFIHQANTDAKKQELFARVRSGNVRVLMGSTSKMGAGTNCQTRLVALHDLDVPWRPSDLEQRLGRIVRQGNQNAEVDIYRYVTEGTFDSYMYQLVERKQKFISQIMTSKTPQRVAEDVDAAALSYAEIKALATGNPLIIEKCQLDTQMGKLNTIKTNWLNERYTLEHLSLRKYPEQIQSLHQQIRNVQQDVALAAAHPKPIEGMSPMELNGIVHVEKEGAGAALIDACRELRGDCAQMHGHYRGFEMALEYESLFRKHTLFLKGTATHTVELGADGLGNLTRIDNALARLPERLEQLQENLAEIEKQLENAKAQLQEPFPQQEEFDAVGAQLEAVNALLYAQPEDEKVIPTSEKAGQCAR